MIRKQLAFDETELVRSICKESFYDFVKECWSVVIKEEPVWNWHIEFLCNELQAIAERIFRGEPKEYDEIINIPPGTTKSTIVSIMLPCWCWLHMPHFRVIVGTHTYNPLGLDLSRKTRDIIQSRKYQKLFPGLWLRDDQNTKGFFLNNHGGGRLTATVGGVSPLGMHGHLLVVDDPIDPQRALSQADLKRANEWMNNTLPSRKVDKRVTPTVLIMQRLHQNDPTGMWLEQDPDIRHVCLPATNFEGYDVKPRELSDNYIDGLLDPVRLSRDVLEEYKSKGEYSYASQYGQNPVPTGGAMFQVDEFEVVNPAQMPEFVKLVRYWDKAASMGKGAYSAGVLMGVDEEGLFYVVDVKHGQWSVDKRERTIKQTAEEDGVDVTIWMETEGGSAGVESTQYTIRRLAGFRVKGERPTGDKESRALPFADQVNSGNVKLVQGPWNNTYIEELRYFPFGKYMDQVDASSGAFGKLWSRRRSLKEWSSRI